MVSSLVINVDSSGRFAYAITPSLLAILLKGGRESFVQFVNDDVTRETAGERVETNGTRKTNNGQAVIVAASATLTSTVSVKRSPSKPRVILAPVQNPRTQRGTACRPS